MTALDTSPLDSAGLDAPGLGSSAHGEKRPIVYCRRCLIPETKPDIFFDADGVCSACRHYEGRGEVDWDARRPSSTRCSIATGRRTAPSTTASSA